MSYFRDTLKNLRKFSGSEDGIVAPLVAVLLVLLLVFAGMAIDFGIAFNTRRAVNQALDAAVLAAANQLTVVNMNQSDVEDLVEDYFRANIANSIGDNVEVSTPVVNYTAGEDTISASASATIENRFIPLLNLMDGVNNSDLDKMDVSSSSTARFPRNNVEVAVIVDVTGSMRSHIDALERASRTLLDELIPSDAPSNAESKIRISFIPYSYGVRLDDDLAEKATFDLSKDGCVHERHGEQAETDVPHDYAYDKSSSNRNWIDFIGSDVEECPNAKVVPLTDNRDTILDAIESLSADGGTAGQIGIAWGWYTLSPEWADFWPNGSKPADYLEDEVRKYAIIMTDGAFNMYYWDLDESKDIEKEKKKITEKREDKGYPPYDYTQKEYEKMAKKTDWYRYYGYSSEYHIPSSRAKNLCTNMKADDKAITIYSVVFGSGSGTAERVLKHCASTLEGEELYIEASNENQLVAAFAKIANDIKAIYLSQ